MTDFTGNLTYNFDSGIVDYGLTDDSPDIWNSTMSTSNTLTLGPYTTTVGTARSILTANPSYTIGPSWTSVANGTSPTHINSAGKISLNGKEADIEINGVSLSSVLERIESRLGLLRPAHDLEKEWEDLKRIGDEYRQLEAEIREKMRVWELLKKENDGS